ncbi:hypothetical protein JCM6882_004442 [Rhodosporidiobolus microsporus]
MLPLAAFVAIFALASSVAGLTSDQLRLAFPGATQLTGSSIQLPSFELTVVKNSSHALFVVNATSASPSNVGWLGVGHGTAMRNADFVLAWPTISSSSVEWTISHRLPNAKAPSSHGAPAIASTAAGTDTAAFYALVPQLTTSESGLAYAAVAWMRAVEVGEGYPAPQGGQDPSLAATSGSESFIYASATISPGTADEDEATFEQHNQPRGTISLDLNTAIALDSESDGDESSGGGSGGVVSGSSSGTARSTNDKKLIAHATLGSLALLLFTPLAILSARLGRGRKWFPSHIGLNMTAVVFIVIAFALGVNVAGGQFDDFHKRLGLALFLLFLLQPLLGLLAHSYSLPSPLTSSVHPSLHGGLPSPLRALHILTGLTIVGLGYAQVASGIYKEWPRESDAMTAVPMGVKAVFWVLLGVEVAAYVGSWAWGAATRGRAVEREGWERRPSTVAGGSGNGSGSVGEGRPSVSEAPGEGLVGRGPGGRQIA